MHGTGVYSVGVGLKGSALERFSDIKRKEKKDVLFLNKAFVLVKWKFEEHRGWV